MTEILKVDKTKPESGKIKFAAEIIKKGGLVAFPTETVYGLGANALDSDAVRKIFEAKGRPADNPLIVHIAERKELDEVALDVSEDAERLMKKFWPGPLTLVLKKKKCVPDAVTAGLDSVAVRMPSHPVALALIKKAGVPIAAPSANSSGKPSPTSAEHVIEDLSGKIEMILDGGKTEIGVESTVIDMTKTKAVLLRPGGIGVEEIEEVIGKIEVHDVVKGKKVEKFAAGSPGMKYRHYAPNAELVVIEGDSEKRIKELIEDYRKKGKKVGVITLRKNNSYSADSVIFVGERGEDFARNLFDAFRRFNSEGIEVILSESIEEKGIGLAVMNRLRKAASGK